MNLLGKIYAVLGKHEESKTILNNCVMKKMEVLGPSDTRTTQAMRDLHDLSNTLSMMESLEHDIHNLD